MASILIAVAAAGSLLALAGLVWSTRTRRAAAFAAAAKQNGRAPERSSASQSAPLREPASSEAIAEADFLDHFIFERFRPLDRLGEDEIRAAAGEFVVERLTSGAEHSGDPQRVYYLIDGIAELRTTGEVRRLDGSLREVQEHLELSAGAVSLRAVTELRLLSVARSLVTGLLKSSEPTAAESAGPIHLPKVLGDSSLYHVLRHALEEGSLEVPSLPPITARLQNALRNDSPVEEIARIVQMDPSLATKLIRVANSPLFAGTGRPVTSCQAAILLLGVKTTRSIVMSLGVGQLFRSSRSDLRKRMQAAWRHSMQTSVLCAMIARRVRCVDPDTALLAGLVSYIGLVPILDVAARFPADYCTVEELDACIAVLRGPIGRRLLQSWSFAPEFLRVPESVENWSAPSPGPMSLSDVVQLAAWHGHVMSGAIQSLPALESLAAFHKLDEGELTPDRSLKWIYDARDTLQNTLREFVD